MQTLSVNFQHCFWIKNLTSNFIFPQGKKVISLYAKNWMMKTSFLKIFEKYQKNTLQEIRDNIFWNISQHAIHIDGNIIDSSQIFTLGQVDEKYQSWNIATLLINEVLKNQYTNILALKYQLLRQLKEKIGLSIPTSSTSLEVSKLEKKLLKDFALPEDSFLQWLLQIELPDQNDLLVFNGCLYKDIFDDWSIEQIIWSQDFQDSMQNFLDQANNLFNQPQYSYLVRGRFSFGQFQEVAQSLQKNNFFSADGNALCLAWRNQTQEELNAMIVQIEESLHSTAAFRRIREKLNTTEKWKKLVELLETIPNLLDYIRNFELFRKQLWYVYLNEIVDDEGNIIFNEIKRLYQSLLTAIDNINVQTTERNNALAIFKDRFHMPFEMRIDNLQNVVFGEIPVVRFEFRNEDTWRIVLKQQSEISNTLSQWEKRALFLLNMIFDLEKIKKDIEGNPGQEILIIADDVADSFDYRNKYAIVEYLQELAESQGIYLIILTHNYDFFRCINSRLSIRDDCKKIVNRDSRWTLCIKDAYSKEPWEEWKSKVCPNDTPENDTPENDTSENDTSENEKKKYLIALIPFVRNLIQYARGSQNDNFLFLTHLLHWKAGNWAIPETQNISFNDLLPIYNAWFWTNIQLENSDQCIYNYLNDPNIFEWNSLAEKILYAIVIRLYAEQIMLTELPRINPNVNLNPDRDQFWDLYGKFINCLRTLPANLRNERQRFERIKSVLNRVSIMTPESIHFNSFMYEPIIDMDIIELQHLYDELQHLYNEV